MANQFEMANGILQPLSDDDQAAYDAQQTAWEVGAESRTLSALAAHRYTVQNGGTTISGNVFKTDAESRLALLAVYSVASANPSFECAWKTATGNFVTLNATAIIAAGNAVLEFVQKCFDVESALTSNIGNYIADPASIITAFDTGMAA